jgi:glycosyltransferase involved in cell wall biosynthesis
VVPARLLRTFVRHGPDWRGTGDGALLDGLRQRRAGVDVQVLPWHPREAMPDLYRRADLTVCFSGVPEGFGLTAVESVACGTPVLAWPAGAVAELLPAGHGLVLAERDATPPEWAAATQRAVAVGARDCVRGRYIREHYDAALMADRYRALAAQLLDAA